MEDGHREPAGAPALDGASERERDAAALLRETVFASRARQAASSALHGLAPAAARPSAAGGNPDCGLGAETVVELELDEKGARLLAGLLAGGPRASLGGAERERVRGVMREWVEAQDALDRARNHFLKDFRTRHGFDRSAYGPAQREAFEAGLAKVNAKETERLVAHARRLLDALDGR